MPGFKTKEEYATEAAKLSVVFCMVRRVAGGSMDFWDKLSESEKRLCREVLERLEKAPAERVDV